MSKIRINSSNLAALIGRNRFATFHDAVLVAWKSSDDASYRDAHRRCGVETPEQRKQRIRDYYPELDAIARSTKPSLLSTNRLLARQEEWDRPMFLPERGEHALPPITAKDAADLARETAYTNHGIDRESTVLETVNEVMDRRFEASDTLFAKTIGTTRSGRDVVVQGRVDAMDATTVLEIKTRARGLFMQLKDYERVQVQSYMLLTDKRDAVLAEAYFPSRLATTPDVNIIPVERDDTDLDAIVARAIEASETVDRLLSDPSFQREFLANT